MVFMLWPLQIINSTQMIFYDKVMYYCCELAETTETGLAVCCHEAVHEEHSSENHFQ